MMSQKLLLLICISLIMFQPGFSQNNNKEIYQQLKQNHQHARETKRELLKAIDIVQLEETDNQRDFDIIHYDLNLVIVPTHRSISGTVEVQAKSLIDGLSHVELNLYDNMIVDSVSGNAVSASHADNLLVLELDKPYNQEEIFKVVINYQGFPVKVQNLGLNFGSHGGHYAISSVSCPYYARTWWPCKDVPWDKADSVDMRVNVPNDLIVASNGLLREVIDNGDGTKTFYWHEGYPISTYLVMLAIADYETISDRYIAYSGDSLDVIHYVFPDDYQAAAEDFKNIPGMIHFYASIYGEYPYITEKFGMAEYDGAFAGMEHQTMVSYHSSLITGNHANEIIAAHELAHQWWGDCVTVATWHDTWLSEGFATYSESLYSGYLEGQEAYHDYMNITLNSLQFTEPVYRYETDQPFDLYDDVVYDKGAWVLHMLRHVVGDTNFFKILSEYRNAFAYGNATTDEFRQTCENVYQGDLTWFFQQWIYDAGFPQYRIKWTSWQSGDKYVIEGIVTQVQTNADIFKMPVDITIETVNGDTTHVVWVDNQDELFKFSVDEQPINFIFDRDNWILKDVLETKREEKVSVRGYNVDDRVGGNDNGAPEAGETIDLVISLFNQFKDMEQLHGELSTTNPHIEIIKNATEFDSTGQNGIVHNHNNPFKIKIDNDTPNDWIHLDLKLTDKLQFEDTLSCRIFIGTAPVLLVDDDGNDSYEDYYLSVLDSLNILVDHWDVAYRGLLKATRINDYLNESKLVIWFTGNSDSATLTGEDQETLQKFLDDGGQLFLTGQDIGKDLVENGNGTEFYEQYLHAHLVQENYTGPKGLTGISGDDISDGLMLVLTGPEGANNQYSPSVIAPVAGAVPIFNYLGTNNCGALKYENSCKLIYFAFGFEAITKTNSRTADPVTVMSRVLTWMNLATGMKNYATDNENAPNSFYLLQNYPNPYKTGISGSTRMGYHIAIPSHITLEVYNIRGQLIQKFMNTHVKTGTYAVDWNGCDRYGNKVPAGIYICTVKIRPFLNHDNDNTGKKIIKTKKMIVLN